LLQKPQEKDIDMEVWIRPLARSNAHELEQQGKLAQLAKEPARLNLEILGLSKVR